MTHPWRLTWNLKISPWKRRFLLETIILRFHVKLWGCIIFTVLYCGRKGQQATPLSNPRMGSWLFFGHSWTALTLFQAKKAQHENILDEHMKYNITGSQKQRFVKLPKCFLILFVFSRLNLKNESQFRRNNRPFVMPKLTSRMGQRREKMTRRVVVFGISWNKGF